MKVQASYKIFTLPHQTTNERPIMLAALPGGPGMSYGYLRELVGVYPSLGIDWQRVDEQGHPLHRQYIQLDAQVDALETCRQLASQEMGLKVHADQSIDQSIKLIPVCHSAGAPRGILWASRYPEHVAGLVLLDAQITSPELPYSTTKTLFHLLRYAALHWKGGLEGAFRHRFMDLVGHYYFVHSTLEHKQALTQAFTSPFLPLLQETGFARWDVQKQLEALEIPILFIHGTQDRIISSTIAHQQQNRNGDLVTLCLVEGAGHMPMVERPQETSEGLRAFLKSVGGFENP